MSNKDWYDSESWYRPLHSEQPQSAEQVTKKPKRRRWRAVGAAALAVLLLVGSSIAFREPKKTAPGGSGGSGGSAPATEEEMPDDWREFFRNFYETVNTDTVEIHIERVETPIRFSLASSASEGEELSLQELYQTCAPSVVGITGYVDGRLGYSWGTGLILSADGLILTNTHVIEDCDRAVVTLYDDSEYEARLVGADAISDVAVLKIEAKGLPAAAFGDSEQLTVGERVAAIGNPLGEQFRFTLTDGIVSAIERGVNYKGRSMVLLQTNTALNEGNSGGPLFNMYGQVVGITNMKMMSSGSNIEGIGFAIPSATACSVVNALVKDGEVRGRPAIGITVGAIPEIAKERYQDKLPQEGLYISAVSEGSDAEAKGLREGDILLAVNGETVTTTAQVGAIKDRFQVGDSLTFTIWRDGETFDVDVLLIDTNDIYG